MLALLQVMGPLLVTKFPTVVGYVGVFSSSYLKIFEFALSTLAKWKLSASILPIVTIN